jgi:hypothetical protein
MKLLYFALGIIALRLLDILTAVIVMSRQTCEEYMELEYPEHAYRWN